VVFVVMQCIALVVLLLLGELLAAAAEPKAFRAQAMDQSAAALALATTTFAATPFATTSAAPSISTT